MKHLIHALALVVAVAASPAIAQDCDALPRNMAFCAAGGQWQRKADDSPIVTYTDGEMVLTISVFDLPQGFDQPQDELRQTLNGMIAQAHKQETGTDIRYWIEDELYIEDFLANRLVYTAQFGGQTRTIAESIVLRDGWFVSVSTSQPGADFSDRHIALHDDALGRIGMY